MRQDWSSLPSVILGHIADCLLATNDVDYYMDFRAVCTTWRSATEDPKSNPSDLRFHPRRWILVDEVFQTSERLMVNTSTGRVIHKDLPLLRKYEVVATTPCGFLVLADLEPPHAARVLNPLTGHMIKFNVFVPVEMGISAAALSGGALPELFLFSDRCYEQYSATPDKDNYHLMEFESVFVWTRLAVGGGICTNGVKGVVTPLPFDFPWKLADVFNRFDIDPSKLFSYDSTAGFSELPGTGHANHCFVVESAGELCVVVTLQGGELKVLSMGREGDELEPVKSIVDRAIFVGYRRCLSVSTDKFPSIVANCVYYVKSTDSSLDIYKYDLEDDTKERVSGAIDSLNPISLSFASPPFTIVQLLCSYTINARESQLAIERQKLRDLRSQSQSEELESLMKIMSSMNEESSSLQSNM